MTAQRDQATLIGGPAPACNSYAAHPPAGTRGVKRLTQKRVLFHDVVVAFSRVPTGFHERKRSGILTPRKERKR